MTEGRSSRRDIFRLLGRTIAEAAGGKLPPVPGPRRQAPSPSPPPEPVLEVPLERGRLVVDLALHPIPPQRSRRVHAPGWPEPVLLVRVTPAHFACVTADCPHCEGAMAWEPERETVLCPRGAAAFRLDGHPAEGPRRLRLRVYPCFVLGARVEIDLLPPPEDTR